MEKNKIWNKKYLEEKDARHLITAACSYVPIKQNCKDKCKIRQENYPFFNIFKEKVSFSTNSIPQ